MYLQINNKNVETVLILDIDVHHGADFCLPFLEKENHYISINVPGNGTQEIFYGNKKVVYASLHRCPHLHIHLNCSLGTGMASTLGVRREDATRLGRARV